MARWATLVEIAGVSFTGCRAELVDGNQFASDYRGSVAWANNGTADTQIVNVGKRGTPFGISMLSNEVDAIQEALDAINVAIAARTTFEVLITDELYTVAVDAEVDWSTQWFSHGQPAEGWVSNVIFRFVSKGDIA